jgi:hypothetical protein
LVAWHDRIIPVARLFDNDDPDASQGFKNLKNAPADSTGGQIREGLEQLWTRFEPYADKEFIAEFGRHPEERFWEMYLGVFLLEGHKALRKRDKLPKKRGMKARTSASRKAAGKSGSRSSLRARATRTIPTRSPICSPRAPMRGHAGRSNSGSQAR